MGINRSITIYEVNEDNSIEEYYTKNFGSIPCMGNRVRAMNCEFTRDKYYFKNPKGVCDIYVTGFILNEVDLEVMKEELETILWNSQDWSFDSVITHDGYYLHDYCKQLLDGLNILLNKCVEHLLGDNWKKELLILFEET